MLGPPGFPNFPSVRGKSFSSEFSMLFANKESNIYVAEPHEAGAAVLNRHRYDVYVVYIYYVLDGLMRCKTHGILMDGTCHVVLDKSRQHRVDRHGTRWQCLENSCVQCLGEKRVWSNSIFMKFGRTHWKVVYHIISGKDSWSISIHFFHLSKHLWHPKAWKSLDNILVGHLRNLPNCGRLLQPSCGNFYYQRSCGTAA